MTVKVELSDEVIARLKTEADRRGMTLDALIADLAACLPSEPASSRGRLSFVGIGRSTSGRSAVEADGMLEEGFGRD